MQEIGQVLLCKLEFDYKVIFDIVSTWCAYQSVHYVLKLGKSFGPKWLKTSFSAPDPKVKVFFNI